MPRPILPIVPHTPLWWGGVLDPADRPRHPGRRRLFVPPINASFPIFLLKPPGKKLLGTYYSGYPTIPSLFLVVNQLVRTTQLHSRAFESGGRSPSFDYLSADLEGATEARCGVLGLAAEG